jgi:hypothetical protein
VRTLRAFREARCGMTTTPPLGDPVGMRWAEQRYWNGYISEHTLADGHLVWCTWVPCRQTHVHILIWDDEELLRTLENVCRLQAARQTELLFVDIEES